MQEELDINFLRRTFPMLSDQKLLEEILEVGKFYHFKAGDKLMDYGDNIRMVPLVLEGVVRVSRRDEDGREVLLYYLLGGQTCAMAFTCCMMHRQSEISTIAEEDTEVIGIPLEYMEKWMSYTAWRNFVLTSYQQRFEEVFQTLDNLAFKQMDERLVHHLVHKSRSINSPILLVTHQDIARDLNVSREAVSRLLKKLENEGWLELGRNRIDLHRKLLQKYKDLA